MTKALSQRHPNGENLLVDHPRQQGTVPGSEREERLVPKLLESLQRRMPWILIGYSKELDALWSKQKAQFFQLMEQRRTQLSLASR